MQRDRHQDNEDGTLAGIRFIAPRFGIHWKDHMHVVLQSDQHSQPKIISHNRHLLSQSGSRDGQNGIC